MFHDLLLRAREIDLYFILFLSYSNLYRSNLIAARHVKMIIVIFGTLILLNNLTFDLSKILVFLFRDSLSLDFLEHMFKRKYTGRPILP